MSYGGSNYGTTGGGYAGGQQQGGYGQQQQGYGQPGYGQGGYAQQAPQYGSGGYAPPGGQPGGFSAHRPPPGPPPNADPQLWQWFSSVDADRSGAITAEELQTALVNGDWTPFDLDTVKMLMSIFDTDRSGTIGFAEFTGLWKYIKDWQGVFRHFDRDRSGSIDGGELDAALKQFGFNLSPALMHLLLSKYASAPLRAQPGAPPPGVTFDRFVRACVVIKTLTESFQRLDTQRSGYVQLNYDQFMHTVLSTP